MTNANADREFKSFEQLGRKLTKGRPCDLCGCITHESDAHRFNEGWTCEECREAAIDHGWSEC